MDRQLWKPYVALATVAISVVFLLPGSGWSIPAWEVAVGGAEAFAVIIGVHRHRPPVSRAWYLFAAGIALYTGGIGLRALLVAPGAAVSSPSPADAFSLSLYPALVFGLVLLIRHRTPGRHSASVIDALAIFTGLGLVLWVFLVSPTLGDASLSVTGQVVVLAYPIGDVIVLALLTRLFVGAGNRSPAVAALTAAVVAFLVGNLGRSAVDQLGLHPAARFHPLMQVIFLFGFALIGVAALHPSVRELTDEASRRRPELSFGLLAVFTVTSLVAPSVLALEVVHHHIVDGLAIAAGSALLFLFVIGRMAQRFHQVERQSGHLRELTHVDELTGLPNRRAWSLSLPRAIEQARRDGSPLSVAMVDLDHFKRFNDEYGHPAGDRLLRSVSSAWQSAMRSGDQIARYAGDEFIVVLPNADAEAATVILDRLSPVTPLGQTHSAGVASWDGTETWDQLVARADQALYQAKAAGRARLAVADTPVTWPFAPVRLLTAEGA